MHAKTTMLETNGIYNVNSSKQKIKVPKTPSNADAVPPTYTTSKSYNRKRERVNHFMYGRNVVAYIKTRVSLEECVYTVHKI